MVHGVIYGLHEPLTGELRYIGQTTTTVSQRLSKHLTPASLRRHSYLARWLLGLAKRGLSPIWSVLAEAKDQAELDRLEVELIAKARREGVRLVNLSGGGGRAGYVKHTEEWKAHMSAVMSGRCTNTPEHMARLAEMKRGVPRSEETKSKISEAKKGRPTGRRGESHTEETKAKIRANRKGKLVGSQHHQYRPDVSTADILRMILEGMAKVEVARQLGVAPTFVHRRLKQAQRAGVDIPKTRRTAWNKGKPRSPEHSANWYASRWASEGG